MEKQKNEILSATPGHAWTRAFICGTAGALFLCAASSMHTNSNMKQTLTMQENPLDMKMLSGNSAKGSVEADRPCFCEPMSVLQLARDLFGTTTLRR